jgi:dCTP deaminase
MAVLSDAWIKKMALEFDMIKPFESRLMSQGIISYGLSSYGYDIRLANKYKKWEGSQDVDPKHVKPEDYKEYQGSKIILDQSESILGMSHEYLKIPRNVLALCIGKSSYARSGILINITPLEPEWEGFITISIINGTRHRVVLYPDEGIAQIIFFKADEVCEISYKDRKGKYQAQQDIVIPKI